MTETLPVPATSGVSMTGATVWAFISDECEPLGLFSTRDKAMAAILATHNAIPGTSTPNKIEWRPEIWDSGLYGQPGQFTVTELVADQVPTGYYYLPVTVK